MHKALPTCREKKLAGFVVDGFRVEASGLRCRVYGFEPRAPCHAQGTTHLEGLIASRSGVSGSGFRVSGWVCGTHAPTLEGRELIDYTTSMIIDEDPPRGLLFYKNLGFSQTLHVLTTLEGV
jgi:hypothetical protein